MEMKLLSIHRSVTLSPFRPPLAVGEFHHQKQVSNEMTVARAIPDGNHADSDQLHWCLVIEHSLVALVAKHKYSFTMSTVLMHVRLLFSRRKRGPSQNTIYFLIWD